MASKLAKYLVLRLIPEKLKTFLVKESKNYDTSINQYSTVSYSQEGEDLILERFFGGKQHGFYVDIGAHHPKRFSNTFKFYEIGWSGINIDPMPGIMKLFDEERPRDINLELGISSSEQLLTYYMFNEPALNTFSQAEADVKNGLNNYQIIGEKIVKTQPLAKVLLENLPQEQDIDFMTIDVEGLDLEVLKSNDWQLYRPAFLLVEDLVKQSVSDFQKSSALYDFLVDCQYELMAKTFNTYFFKDKNAST